MDHLGAAGRRAAAAIGIVAMIAVGLGLVAPAPARTSCAGPQLSLVQGGASVPARRVPQGADERLLHDVARRVPLQVLGSNLTFDCDDTVELHPGCGGPTVQPEPIVPLQQTRLVLSQGDRRWKLGELGAVRPDLTADAEVSLPAEVRPGRAVLSLVDQSEHSAAQLDLMIS